jgi:cyclin A
VFFSSRKCEEVYPPNAAEFAYVTDNAYTKKQVLKIEDLLLQTLHFEVSTVTTHTFLLHYLKLAEVDEVTEDLARVY